MGPLISVALVTFPAIFVLFRVAPAVARRSRLLGQGLGAFGSAVIVADGVIGMASGLPVPVALGGPMVLVGIALAVLFIRPSLLRRFVKARH
ncbi:hypothetical protein QO003_000880 [Arthrobacter silviterrae]|nr:hypothetical protein [Arthrobacter silviterrae]